MEPIKVCRICLVMDVNMHNLHCYPLGTYYEPITGINPLTLTDLPPFACYECATLIKKFYFFRERCLRGQAALFSILHTTGQISTENVKQIDREYLHLTSNISFGNETKSKEFCFSHKEAEENNVKIEPVEQRDNILDYDEDFSTVKDENDYDDITSLPSLSSDDVEPLSLHKSNKDKKRMTRLLKQVIKTEQNVKSEHFEGTDNILQDKNHFDDTTSLPSLSSDDNEPLSFHKSNKVKKQKKRFAKKVRKTKKNDKGLISENTCEKSLSFIESTRGGSMVPPGLTEVIKPKAKRGRPRKIVDASMVVKKPKPRRTRNTGGVPDDELDIEEYVTVIKLSVEEQIEEITSRQLSSNFQNAPFKCDLCFKGFIDTHAWKHHVGKHDPSAGELQCSICKFRFKTKRTLQKHVTNHEKKYACKACPYVSKTRTQAKQHQRWHKGVTYKCQYCDEISTKWTSYLSHVRIKHPSQYICGACGYSFVSRLGLAMHRTMMHKDLAEELKAEHSKDGGLYCEQCDVKFVSVEAWKRHMVTSVKHTQSTDLSTGCRVCGETFKSAEELRLHHRREHARKRPKNYGKKQSSLTWPTECIHCSEEIANARDYWAHFRRVHPDKNYPIQKNYICDICGKSFRGNAFLVYHKRTHTEERAFKCAQCPKAFFNRTNLQMHERTHSNVRPHPCAICCKAFKCKGALERHSRSHTGEKPYECDVCGKAFAQSNTRKLHVNTVHLKQPSPYISRNRRERRNRLTHQVY